MTMDLEEFRRNLEEQMEAFFNDFAEDQAMCAVALEQLQQAVVHDDDTIPRSTHGNLDFDDVEFS